MTLEIASVTMDCGHAARTAEFWSQAFGWDIDDGAGDFFARLVKPDGSTGMMFIRVPEPKTVKNRVHLDLSADDRAGEVDRLVGLGAEVVHDKEEWGVRWTTMRDPEGNEFCVADHSG